MLHSSVLSNINPIHERILRITYKDIKLTFEELLL